MASYTVHYNFEYIDKNGDVAVMRIPTHLVDTTTIAALVTALDAGATAIGAPGTMSNATPLRRSISIFETGEDPSATPAVDAIFPSVADKARLQFLAPLSGSKLVVALPAPIEAIFAAPPADDTVASASAVAALITWVEGNAKDVGGNAFSVYTSGVRQKSRARRRKTHRG
jgi:hypothetical protein